LICQQSVIATANKTQGKKKLRVLFLVSTEHQKDSKAGPKGYCYVHLPEECHGRDHVSAAAITANWPCGKKRPSRYGRTESGQIAKLTVTCRCSG